MLTARGQQCFVTNSAAFHKSPFFKVSQSRLTSRPRPSLVFQAADGASNLSSSRGLNKTSLQVGESPNAETLNTLEQGSVENKVIKDSLQENVVADDEEEQWKEWIDLIDQSIQLIADTEARMQEAVVNEDYAQAQVEKQVIDSIKEGDPLENIVQQLDAALASEDYDTASKLRDQGQLTLLGWWVGKGEANDPHGHLLHVTREYGRLVGKAYTPNQIQQIMGESQTSSLQTAMGMGPLKVGGRGATASGERVLLKDTGNCVFEVYLNENGETQPFVLQPSQENAQQIQGQQDMNETSSYDALIRPDNVVVNPKDSDEQQQDKELINIGLEQLLAQQMQNSDDSSSSGSEKSEQYEEEVLEIKKERNPCSLNLFGVNRFQITAPALSDFQLGQQRIQLSGQHSLSSRGVLADNAKKQQMYQQIQQAVQQLSKNPSKDRAEMKKQLKNILREAFKKVLGEENLGDDVLVEAKQAEEVVISQQVWYDRLHLSYPLTDPFSGYYIGSFGPNGLEILHLRRTVDAQNQEWVVASKLTGDPHVPAGIECFKAKIGKGQRINADYYPPELEVVGRYKGEGRIAEAGFQNPRWVEGELLIFNGGYKPMIGVAELGVLYSAPGLKNFLILLHRLDLDSFQ